MLETDVCVLGAGPGGVAAALKLSYLGIPCAVIDKAVFPRDKVCGDAISFLAISLLKELDPEILKNLRCTSFQLPSWGIRLVTIDGDWIDVPVRKHTGPEYESPGIVSKRIDFDNFLVEELRKRENITFCEGVEIRQFEKNDRGFIIRDKSGDFALFTKLLIAADGANSYFARQYVGYKLHPKHHSSAVRAYFKNVKDLHQHNLIELHFIREILPGYFWIFPLPDNEVNVGLGMLTDEVRKRKVNLRKTLLTLLRENPYLSPRFKDAKMVGEVGGYSLPFGSLKKRLSGDHFMLVGDAGHLIDPLSGEGISNAIFSGIRAAEMAQRCLQESDFSAEILLEYDRRIYEKLGPELKRNYKIQRSFRHVWLWKILMRAVQRREEKMKQFMVDAINHPEQKIRFINPIFWIKIFLNVK